MPATIGIVFESAFGCFTRPEFAAERYSYEIPTPTAARGMIEAIFWKPEIRYHIVSVSKVLHSSGDPCRFVRLTTNEVGSTTPSNVGSNRQQRRCLILRNPAFLIEAQIEPGARPITTPGHTLLSYYEMLKRRLIKGQCVETPVMGLRDYPASFRLSTQSDVPVSEDRPLGPMTYLVWGRQNWPNDADRSRATEMAVIENGVVDMRSWLQ